MGGLTESVICSSNECSSHLNATLTTIPRLTVADSEVTHGEVEVYTWGRGDFGQLAQGSEQTMTAPTLAKPLVEKRVTHVSSNLYHTAAVTGERSMRTNLRTSIAHFNHSARVCPTGLRTLAP
eukprot:6866206-Pyramimonas_sp.AAC.1